jgi:nicotinamide-nucleotide amidase
MTGRGGVASRMEPMHVRSAELLAVGTELLLGEIVDTNSAWLAQQLADRSVDVYWSQRVGDNRARIAASLRQALGRSDLVVVCGGLGPTDDDLTREAIADVVGETPRVDAGLEAVLRARFARFSRSMPERNLKQAWLIPSAEALPNPVGTAPGWFVRTSVDGTARAVVALPGPPRELTTMWLEQARPRLAFPVARFVARTIKTFGVGESHVAELLEAWTQAANPSVATYAKRDGVHVRVAAKGADEAEARARLAPAAAAVEAVLGDAVWGHDEDELPARALAALTARRGRLAIVDLATGGRFAALLSEAVPEAAATAADAALRGSGALLGGVIAWRDEALEVLGVPHAVRGATDRHPLGGASGTEATDDAVELARAACARFATDHGVALTPWRIGATEGLGDRAGWTASWAVVGPHGIASRRLSLPPHGAGGRDERLAFSALFALWSLTRT